MNTNHLRGEEVPEWIQLHLWKPIDHAVCKESERIRMAARFLEMHGPITN
jgi:hypothetical protein